MTREEILAVPVGVELDAAVLRALWGVKKVYRLNLGTMTEDEICKPPVWNGEPLAEGDDLHYIPSGKPWRTHQIDARHLPRLSLSPWGEWWAVVKQMREKGFAFSLWLVPAYSSVMNAVAVAFQYGVYPPERCGSEQCFRARSAPGSNHPGEAVCRAALLAVLTPGVDK